MNLLSFLLVEFIQHPIVLHLVSEFHFFQPMDFKCIVDDQKAALQFQGIDF